MLTSYLCQGAGGERGQKGDNGSPGPKVQSNITQSMHGLHLHTYVIESRSQAHFYGGGLSLAVVTVGNVV